MWFVFIHIFRKNAKKEIISTMEKSFMFQIQRLVLVPSLLHSLIMYLGLRVSIQSYSTCNWSFLQDKWTCHYVFLENFNLDFTQYHISYERLKTQHTFPFPCSPWPLKWVVTISKDISNDSLWVNYNRW